MPVPLHVNSSPPAPLVAGRPSLSPNHRVDDSAIAPMAALAEFKDLQTFLNGLPASANKYEALADYLMLTTQLWDPTELRVEVTLNLVGYILLVVTALIFLGLKRPWALHHWWTTDRGLLKPNAANFIALFHVIYGCVTISDLVVQLALADKYPEADFRHWISLAGMMFIPLYIHGWFFTWAIVVVHLGARGPATDDLTMSMQLGLNFEGPRSIWRWRRFACCVNFLGIAPPIVGAITISYFFAWLQAPYGQVFDLIKSMADSIRAAGADPASDPNPGLAQILPLLAPMPHVLHLKDELYHNWRTGWAVVTGWAVLTLLVFTPFTFLHIRLLGKLVSAQPDRQDPPSSGGVAAWIVAKAKGWNEYHTILVVAMDAYILVITTVPTVIWCIFVTAPSTKFQRVVLMMTQFVFCVIGNFNILCYIFLIIRARRCAQVATVYSDSDLPSLPPPAMRGSDRVNAAPGAKRNDWGGAPLGFYPQIPGSVVAPHLPINNRWSYHTG